MVRLNADVAKVFRCSSVNECVREMMIEADSTRRQRSRPEQIASAVRSLRSETNHGPLARGY